VSFMADTRCNCSVRAASNFGARGNGLSIDMLVIHYTGMESGKAAIDWLCAEESGVSCHYLVEEDGSILQMVPELHRAWHAGKSEWQGITDTNSRSIGIEIVNPGHDHGYQDFPDDQISAVIDLSRDILDRNQIPARNILAHSDVSPGRKQDPGERFPWRLLWEKGVGHWTAEDVDNAPFAMPGHSSEETAAVRALLSTYGYGIEVSPDYDDVTKECVIAFQQHFRQSRVDGVADIGTYRTLERLIASVPSA